MEVEFQLTKNLGGSMGGIGSSKILVSGLLLLMLAASLLGVLPGSPAGAAEPIQTDPGLKIAMIGDGGLGQDAAAVLELIGAEGADMLIYAGDFDYVDDPAAFEALLNTTLGPDFPIFATVGNHDLVEWPTYKQNFVDRLGRVPDATCAGDYGVNATCTFRGLQFILSGVGTLGFGHEAYLDQQLTASQHTWRLCAWHKNQTAMQVGSKTNEVGWLAYETCREHGAMIITGHEHSYSRTKTLVDMDQQIVDPTWPLANQVRVGPGATFAAVSGLGGKSIRPQNRCLPSAPPYGCNGEWASISSSSNGASDGAMFVEFNVDGDPNKAIGTFKNVNGQVIDSFTITSENATPSSGSTVSFQDGVNGYSGTVDTMMKQGDPTAAFGDLDSIEWDSVASEAADLWKTGFVRFDGIIGDGAGQIPLGATITNATLQVSVFNPGDPAAVHPAEMPWSETTTHDQYGGQIGPSLGSLPGAVGVASVDVTSWVSLWATGTTNYGFVIMPSGPDGVDARSSEYGDVAARPRLQVSFTLDDPDPPQATAIGGTVTANDGSAVSGVQVDLFSANGDGSRGTFLDSTTTGPDGSYSFGVEPGCKVLTFIAPDGESFGGSQWFQPGVCVEAGQEISTVSAVLDGASDPSGDAVIAGQILLADGAPVAGGVQVDLFAQTGDGGRGDFLDFTTTGGDGRFSFSATPGCFVLTYIAPADTSFSGSQWFQPSTCVAAGETVSGLDAVLQSTADGASIGGTITDSAGAPVNGVKVTYWTVLGDGSRGAFIGEEFTDGGGNFARSVPSGCYWLVYVAPPTATFDGTPFLEAFQCVAAGETVSGLNASLD